MNKAVNVDLVLLRGSDIFVNNVNIFNDYDSRYDEFTPSKRE